MKSIELVNENRAKETFLTKFDTKKWRLILKYFEYTKNGLIFFPSNEFYKLLSKFIYVCILDLDLFTYSFHHSRDPQFIRAQRTTIIILWAFKMKKSSSSGELHLTFIEAAVSYSISPTNAVTKQQALSQKQSKDG